MSVSSRPLYSCIRCGSKFEYWTGFDHDHAACEGVCTLCRGREMVRRYGPTPQAAAPVQGGTDVFYLCIICKYETEVDDSQITYDDGRCVCLRCYSRECNQNKPMPKGLLRQLVATLTGLELS